MAARSQILQNFVDCSQAAIAERLEPDSEASRVFATIDRGLQTVQPSVARVAARLPANAHFDAAVATAREAGGKTAALAEALAALEPQLAWQRRRNADPSDSVFYDGHANADIVGPTGLEQRDDIWIGVSLMAPEVRYPDHHHPPQEIYVVLSPGEWRQDAAPWFAPGIGGLVFNKSDTVHAMRSGLSPLLAVWSLWVEGRV